MRTRTEVDPHLAVLRSVASAAGRETGKRSDIEAARFQLYVAFEAKDPTAARGWAMALQAALLAAPVSEDLRKLGMDALAQIRRAI